MLGQALTAGGALFSKGEKMAKKLVSGGAESLVNTILKIFYIDKIHPCVLLYRLNLFLNIAEITSNWECDSID